MPHRIAASLFGFLERCLVVAVAGETVTHICRWACQEQGRRPVLCKGAALQVVDCEG